MDVPLFDVVPWTHGYAHSWALRWMLAKDQWARDRLLGIFLPEGEPPWSVRNMTREFRVGHNRETYASTQATTAQGRPRCSLRRR